MKETLVWPADDLEQVMMIKQKTVVLSINCLIITVFLNAQLAEM